MDIQCPRYYYYHLPISVDRWCECHDVSVIVTSSIKKESTGNLAYFSYLTNMTGQVAWVNTDEATLPSNAFLNADWPLVPITIKSTSLFAA